MSRPHGAPAGAPCGLQAPASQEWGGQPPCPVAVAALVRSVTVTLSKPVLG